MAARPGEAGDVLLAARGLGCTYRGRSRPALAGVDLELRAGTVTLVAGGSASGKTSLLRCLNGLVPRAYRGSRVAGSVRVGGADLEGLAPAEIGRRVGTLLQDPGRQIVGIDVRRELAFGPENLGLAPERVAERVRRAADRLGVADLLDRETDALSGGQRQKVALAGVLAQEPSVLLLDEPLAALDPASAEEVVRLVRELADGGCAVLVVEHRVEDVLAARPEQVLLLEEGEPLWCGDVAGFLERADPRHLHLPVEAAQARWRALDAGGAAPPRVVPERAAPGETLLDLREVGFRFENGVEALRGASLAVGAGEVVALLGPNGAGKSSLLRHAIGLLRPSAGAVEVLGRDAGARTVASLSRDVGYLFQDPGAMLFADTVEEECLFAPRNQGLDEATSRARVRDALARQGLEAHAGEAPRSLSLGQQKRVCLAAVACQGVRVWVLDEPTAGLDPGGVADFLEALAAGSGGRDGVLLATHDLDLALVHATRVAVLADGALVADGEPGRVLLDDGVRARARLATTSLLEANRARVAAGERPLDARALARSASGGGGRS